MKLGILEKRVLSDISRMNSYWDCWCPTTVQKLLAKKLVELVPSDLYNQVILTPDGEKALKGEEKPAEVCKWRLCEGHDNWYSPSCAPPLTYAEIYAGGRFCTFCGKPVKVV